MEDFYFYTVAIALVILIIMLTMIGITLSYGNETKVYPPIENDCPDYWTKAAVNEFGGTITANDINLPEGTDVTNFFKVPIGATNPGNSEFQDGAKINSDYWTDASNSSDPKRPANSDGITGVKTTVNGKHMYYIQLKGNDAEWSNLYPGMSVRCAKQKWALDRGIVWDGVTNYNGCVAKSVEQKKK